MTVRCQIRNCKHYKGIHKELGVPYCRAFSYGIPRRILEGLDDHTSLRRHQSYGVAFSTPNRKIVEPLTIEAMEKYGGSDNVCATLRNIYFMADGNEEIQFWCRMARKMAMNMVLALLDYQQMLVENGIALKHLYGVQRDRMEDWQHRKKGTLYRGKNKANSEGYYKYE